MSKDQAIGGLIFIICVAVIIGYVGLLFLYDPYIASWVNLGAAADVQFWLIAIPVTAAFVTILAIGAWIGWTMATTPSPKPLEEISGEDKKEETQEQPIIP